MIFPLKIVIFHSYVSLPEVTPIRPPPKKKKKPEILCINQQILFSKSLSYWTLKGTTRPTVGFMRDISRAGSVFPEQI